MSDIKLIVGKITQLKDESSKQVEKILDFVRSNEWLFTDLKKTEKRLAEVTNQKDALEAESKSVSVELKRRKEELKRIIDKTQKEVAQKEADFMRVVTQENDRITKVNAELDANLKLFHADSAELKHSQSVLTQDQDTCDSKNNDLLKLAGELNSLQGELNVLKTELSLKESKLNSLDIELCKRANAADKERDDLKKVNEDAFNMQKKLSSMANDLDERDDNLDLREKQIKTIEQSLEGREAKFSDKESAMDKREAALRKKDNDLKDKDKNLKNWQQELEFAAARIKEAENKAKKKGLLEK